jgi:hypothetical protein
LRLAEKYRSLRSNVCTIAFEGAKWRKVLINENKEKITKQKHYETK